jgi:hypothetical protein
MEAVMEINRHNYFSYQAGLEYMSASQLKAFMDCELGALAELHEAHERPETTALLVGGYVDAYFAGELPRFKERHPDIFKRDGTLKADYVQAEEIIARIRDSELASAMLGGIKQPIFTGEIDGIPFRGKADILLTGPQCADICERWPAMSEQLLMADGALVDLKVMRDLGAVWKPGQGRTSFVEAWRYDLQMAIYQRLEGHRLPCFILAVTKETVPDLRLIHIPQYALDIAWEAARPVALRAEEIKRGHIAPTRCGRCDWCKKTRILEGAMSCEDLDGRIE